MRSFEIYQYNISMQPDIYIKDKRLKNRTGIIIVLKKEHNIGRGEISPLPEYSKESLNDALIETKKKLIQWQSNQTLTESHLPSVAFGLSCALAELEQKLPTTSILSNIPCCTGDPDELLITLKQIALPKIAEIKIGLYESIRDGIVVNLLLETIPDLELRLTGCQSWSEQKAFNFIKYINPNFINRIQYISEPCQTRTLSINFAQQYQLPLAFDLCVNHDFDKTIQSLHAVIIKPTLLGSLNYCQSIIEQANHSNIIPIIEHSMESSLGLSQLASFATRQYNSVSPNLSALDLMTHQVIQRIANCQLPLQNYDDLTRLM